MIKAILQNLDYSNSDCKNLDYSNSDCKNRSIPQIYSCDHDLQKHKGFHIVFTWYVYATINIATLYVRSTCLSQMITLIDSHSFGFISKISEIVYTWG